MTKKYDDFMLDLEMLCIKHNVQLFAFDYVSVRNNTLSKPALMLQDWDDDTTEETMNSP